MKHGKTVWVTGASSGLGRYTALALRDAGWTVIAGARSFTEPGEKDGMHLLPLDVTDEKSVMAFCDRALEISPWVSAVVQCAGMLVLGSCEETGVEEYLRVMNTNFLGMVRMNRQVLPVMRAQKEGRIVMYSSINGLLGIPFQNAYTASKHAIEGYAEGLQMEVRPFGIQVTLVEPGDHRGGSGKYRPHAAKMGPDSPYEEAFESAVAKIHHDETNGSDPGLLGKKVARMLERKRMPFRKRIASPDQHLAVWLHRFLPARWNEAILTGYYIKRKKTK
ncbi:MAG: SDR family oxidoreductase [Clostridiales bacterium]|nr:SDR family oxidoreductase [Clostridiales bacterium]